jgi:hypothetical protein
MQNGKDTIPFGSGKTPDWKNKFPGAVNFVESFDTDDDVFESADIL